jgi:hypothetical protein
MPIAEGIGASLDYAADTIAHEAVVVASVRALLHRES